MNRGNPFSLTTFIPALNRLVLETVEQGLLDEWSTMLSPRPWNHLLHFLMLSMTIMCLRPGNHSAGKSSFINWYIEEHVQRTGVAIETQGFSFVTSGRRWVPSTSSVKYATPLVKDLPRVTIFLNRLYVCEIRSNGQGHCSILMVVSAFPKTSNIMTLFLKLQHLIQLLSICALTLKKNYFLGWFCVWR